MKFKSIGRLIVFGGQPFCVRIAEMARDKGLDVWLVAARRNVEDAAIDGQPWEQGMRAKGIPFLVTDAIDVPQVRGLVDLHTLGLSYGAPWIFRKPFIDLFDGRLLNYHPTPLPFMRGGGGQSWRILMGDRHGAFTIHFIDEGIDTGDLVRQEAVLYPEDLQTPADFFAWERGAGMGFLSAFLDDVLAGHDFEVAVQDESASTYYPRLCTDIHGAVDWAWDARALERFVCAFDDPYPGAFTMLGGRKVRLRGARAADCDEVFHPFQSGLVIRREHDCVVVACLGGMLRVDRIVDYETNEALAPALGDKFYTPVADLEKAKASRVVYTPTGMKELG